MLIGLLGAGRLAQALARGFLAAGVTTPDKMVASCPVEDVLFLQQMAATGCHTTHDNNIVVERSKVILVAIKPPVVPKVLAEVAPHVTPQHLIVSCALGVSLHRLEQALPLASRVVRVMPNTPALVQEAASVFSCGTAIEEEDKRVTRKLFSSLGVCEEVPEYLMDAVTGLSGSGPAYIYLTIEALADGGVKMGLPRHLSLKLAAQTVLGAAKMVLTTGNHPGVLKDDVCSPSGSTIEGLHQLEKYGVRSAFIDAVRAATLRASGLELSEPADR